MAEYLKTLKIVQKDDEGNEYNPWVDALQDEWIAILTARRKTSNGDGECKLMPTICFNKSTM